MTVKFEPTQEIQMWQILNGLSSPSHLEIVVVFDEDCNVEPLKGLELEHQWNDLDALTLTGICEHEFMENPPDVFSRISSLTLDSTALS